MDNRVETTVTVTMTTPRGPHKSSWPRGIVVGLLGTFLWASTSHAFSMKGYRWGFSAGYGGTGITNTQTVGSGTATVERSEGPLVVDLFIDRLLSDRFGLTFEHSRGVSLVPFSAGVSFTGVVTRWYFFGPAPSMEAAPSGSTILIKRFVPFAGLAAGIAQASITRDSSDVVQLVSGSGVYFGGRFGADYPLGPGTGLRPQLVYSTTEFSSSFSTSATPPTLTQFSAQCGWYYHF